MHSSFISNFQERVLSMQKGEFPELALEAFQFQAQYNPVYSSYLKALGIAYQDIKDLTQIPFLPIEFYKYHRVQCQGVKSSIVFESSGTTGQQVSKHHVQNLSFYQQLSKQIFASFYGSLGDYRIMALLPSYLERKSASLVYMVDSFMPSAAKGSGFYLDDLTGLARKMNEYSREKKPVLLIGVTFALLDLADLGSFDFGEAIIMETGGMKGRRKEILRTEVHERLCQRLGVNKIHSEYGMTEMMSQGYSKGNGIFELPPSVEILLREVNDPFAIYDEPQKTGGINIIDLGNIETCCFLETKDLGRKLETGFEVLGRFDNSDIRGCNLMVG